MVVFYLNFINVSIGIKVLSYIKFVCEATYEIIEHKYSVLNISGY